MIKISFYRRIEDGVAQNLGMVVFEKDDKLYRIDEGTEFVPDSNFVLEDTIEVTQESFSNIQRSLRGRTQ